MTILGALAGLYNRMAETDDVPRSGYSTENISFSVVLDADGYPLRLADKRNHVGKRPVPIRMNVPIQEGVRASGIRPNFLWDKTAYVFGITAVEKKDSDGNKFLMPGQGKRTAKEHTAFVTENERLLSRATDPGLVALRRFLEIWRPEMFEELGFNPEALDQNVVFEFDDGSGPGFVHKRPASVALIASFVETLESKSGLCLVTGQHGPVARLHPKIKGVMGAQSAGASLVSFNDTAYESFGRFQGGNAPVSKRVAFAYGTALNELLEKDSKRHLRIGDSTVVFWAEAERREVAKLAEIQMFNTFNPPDEASESMKLQALISDIASGRPHDLKLDPATRVYILGLAPNAARLSVRFWHPGTFGEFARHVNTFWNDLQTEPAAWKGPPAAWSLLYETALRVNGKPKADTIPPLLGGQLMRSVLTGQPLPRTLLSAVIARIRADGEINGRRAAICKAVINRITRKENIPVALEPENSDPAYRLGRLFAVLERAQEKALQGLNATIKDRYFSAASATPARVFPLLVRNATHHIALLRKKDEKSRRSARWLERQIGTIWLGLDADMPRSLSLEDQGRFIAGYYHQLWTKTKKDENGTDTPNS